MKETGKRAIERQIKIIKVQYRAKLDKIIDTTDYEELIVINRELTVLIRKITVLENKKSGEFDLSHKAHKFNN